jgi:hypothetical protein
LRGKTIAGRRGGTASISASSGTASEIDPYRSSALRTILQVDDMNKNSRQKAKLLSKQFAQKRREGPKDRSA